jgi:hypothetical protein
MDPVESSAPTQPTHADTQAGSKAIVGRNRNRLRWAVAVIAALAVAALASTYFYFANTYMPLSVTGGGTDLSPGSLYLRTANGEFGAKTTEVFCSTPNGHFPLMLVLINNGPVPVTLIGGDPGQGGQVNDHTNVTGFSLTGLAPFRQSVGGDPLDPWSAPTLPPTKIEPGQTLEVWARFQLGPQKLQPGVELYSDRIWLRFSTFGIERTAGVPLLFEIAVTGDC